MHLSSPRIFTVVVSTCAAGLVAPAVHADLTTTVFDNDLDANAAIDVEAFVAEGRIGNAATNGTFELDLGPSTAAPADTDQFAWGDGITYDFSITYDAGTDLVTFTFDTGDILGTQTMQYTLAGDEVFTDVFIRTRTQDGATATVSNIVIDGMAAGEDSSVTGSGVEIVQISGANLMDGFTMTGSAMFDWDGSPPINSQLAFQMKFATAVPAPGALALLACTGLAGTRRRRCG